MREPTAPAAVPPAPPASDLQVEGGVTSDGRSIVLFFKSLRGSHVSQVQIPCDSCDGVIELIRATREKAREKSSGLILPGSPRLR